jgi:hypothetical protein
VQTIFRLEARWTGGPPPAAVAAALEALPRYDGDALMDAVRVLSPAAMHTGFLLHELRDRCELRRVRRDDRLWKLELRGPADGQADVCCVLDFLDALGFRHVSVAGPDAVGDEHVLSATLWRQRFVDDAEFELVDLDGEDDDDDEDIADDDADDPDGLAFDDEDGFTSDDLRHAALVDIGDESMPDWGPPVEPGPLSAIRAEFAALAAVGEGSVVAALDAFARVEARVAQFSDMPAMVANRGAFHALAQAHGERVDDTGIGRVLYAHYAGLAAQGLEIERAGALAMLVARAGQFSRVMLGLLADSTLHGADDDLSGLVGIARAASGSFHLLEHGEPLP